MSADLLREAASAIGEDYASGATGDGRLIDPFMFAVAAWLVFEAETSEIAGPNRQTRQATAVARAYLGRTS